MLLSRFSRVGFGVFRSLSRGRCRAFCITGTIPRSYVNYLQPLLQSPQDKLSGTSISIFQKYRHFCTGGSSGESSGGSQEKQMISVTFVDKDGEEKQIKVPVGMSMLEAAHEHDIELEGNDYSVDSLIITWLSGGACEGSLACSTCHVIVMDVDFYNKLEDPTDEENDMLDLAFGLSETSRLGCQVIASPELDGMRLAIPAATRNFAVDGYVPKPH